MQRSMQTQFFSSGSVILAEYSSSILGNAGVVSLQILEKINASNGERLSYLVGDHIAFNRRVPFAFLEDVRIRFTTAHGSAAANAAAYSFNQTFAPILQERAAYHNNPSNDTVSRVTGEVNGLREVMVENIERVLERGDRLELLVQKTDELSDSAFVFKRGATTLKRDMWYRNIRTSVYVVLLIILGLYILAALICGPSVTHC
ncbi:hypothetical protein KSW81_006550 [Nannochloris sp. 'desiccata']|nr:hypothetical protein KSW81_006550 [Chlorella desiccata (nom. nud.)]